MLNGALVQLVRMPACHAGGRWFESCTHRKKISLTSLWLMRDVSFIGESFSNAQCIMHNVAARGGYLRLGGALANYANVAKGLSRKI